MNNQKRGRRDNFEVEISLLVLFLKSNVLTRQEIVKLSDLHPNTAKKFIQIFIDTKKIREINKDVYEFIADRNSAIAHVQLLGLRVGEPKFSKLKTKYNFNITSKNRQLEPGFSLFCVDQRC